MREFRLYGTSACHLCELAHDMLIAVQRQRRNFTLEHIDISESDELFACYGERIPVLRHPAGGELNWPFSMAQASAFLDS